MNLLIVVHSILLKLLMYHIRSLFNIFARLIYNVTKI